MLSRVKARNAARKPARISTPPAASGQVEVRPIEREVTIAPAKGRPMLTWVGKHALRHVPAFPAQHIETFDPIGDAARHVSEAFRALQPEIPWKSIIAQHNLIHDIPHWPQCLQSSRIVKR